MELESKGFAIPGFQQASVSGFQHKPPASAESALRSTGVTADNVRCNADQVALLETLLQKEKRIDLLNGLLTKAVAQESHGKKNFGLLEKLLSSDPSSMNAAETCK